VKRTLIVGAGGIGRRHMRAFLETGRARVDFVEPDEDRRRAAREEFEVDAGYAALAEAELGRYDLAVICVPAHLHAGIASTCAEAGLGFLLEKPLAVSMDGVDELIRSVDQRGIPARVGYVRRAAEGFRLLRGDVLDGRIGEARLMYMNASQDFPRYRPDYRTTYYAQAATGGGAILDCASHMIDIAIWLLGRPTEVWCMYDRLQLEGVECEDTCLMALRFEGGAMAQIAVNQFQKPNVQEVEVVGTTGNLRLDLFELRYAGDDSGRWETQDLRGGRDAAELVAGWFRGQAAAMLDALDGEPDGLCTLPEAKLNLAAALGAKESYRTGRIVRL
jgi:predicted dehydrogenase